MSISITNHIKRKFKNANGEEKVITHVRIKYRSPVSDYDQFRIVPIEKADEFANKKDVWGAFVEVAFEAEEAKLLGLL